MTFYSHALSKISHYSEENFCAIYVCVLTCRCEDCTCTTGDPTLGHLAHLLPLHFLVMLCCVTLLVLSILYVFPINTKWCIYLSMYTVYFTNRKRCVFVMLSMIVIICYSYTGIRSKNMFVMQHWSCQSYLLQTLKTMFSRNCSLAITSYSHSARGINNLDIGFNESLEKVFEDQWDLDPDKNLFSRIHNDCSYINPDELNDRVLS